MDEFAGTGGVVPTVAEVKKRRKTKRNINEQHLQSLTWLERLALWMTNHVGTMGFFIIIYA